jgi:nucleoside 2-deoxyribosyltransferase
MWFDPSLDPVWQDAIKPALKSCGFNPIRIDLEEHNEKICDRIISEIRRSGLVVADFTGQRGGVYFESGFAMGLGIPVIRTCRKDDIGSLHFDTRQYSHVVWETPGELKGRLMNRILATVPRIDL